MPVDDNSLDPPDSQERSAAGLVRDAEEPCPYRATSTGEWFDVEERRAGNGSVVLIGTCSRCRHRLRYTSGEVWKGVGAKRKLASGDDEVLIPITCDCGKDHDGRHPAEYYKGCGAYWYYPEPQL